METNRDSYSGFFDNAATSTTGLDLLLKGKGITHVFCCGLAFDYCVGFSALDANKLGFKTSVAACLTRACAAWLLNWHDLLALTGMIRCPYSLSEYARVC